MPLSPRKPCPKNNPLFTPNPISGSTIVTTIFHPSPPSTQVRSRRREAMNSARVRKKKKLSVPTTSAATIMTVPTVSRRDGPVYTSGLTPRSRRDTHVSTSKTSAQPSGTTTANRRLGAARCGRSSGVKRATSASMACASVGIRKVQAMRMGLVGTIQAGTLRGSSSSACVVSRHSHRLNASSAATLYQPPTGCRCASCRPA